MLRSRSFPPPLSAPHTHGVDRQGHRSTRAQWVVGDLPAGTVESCRWGDVRSGRQAAFLSEGGKGTRQPGQRPSEACLRAPNVRHPWRFAAFRPLSLPQEKSKCQTRSPPRSRFSSSGLVTPCRVFIAFTETDVVTVVLNLTRLVVSRVTAGSTGLACPPSTGDPG